MKDTRIREALDANLSGLHVSNHLHREVVNAIKGGKPMQRRISVSLVLVLALLTLSVTAAAATLLNHMFEQVIDMEVEKGPFHTWSYDEKLRLVSLLQENGWDFPDEQLTVLHDADTRADEKEAIVTSLITDAFGREDAVSHIDIIESVKGPMSLWSLEDRFWYSEYIRSKIDVLDTWRDCLPAEGDLTAMQAVSIAREALLKAFGEDARAQKENELNGMIASVSFFTTGGTAEPRWMIDFLQGPYASAAYTVLLTRDGTVTEDDLLGIHTPEHELSLSATPSEPTVLEQLESEKGRCEFWSLEDKAAILGEENGLPAADDISEAMAISIALESLSAQGVDTASFATAVWYKRYDPYGSLSEPFYAIYFIDDPDAPYRSYCVIIDPQSGAVLETTSSTDNSNG